MKTDTAPDRIFLQFSQDDIMSSTWDAERVNTDDHRYTSDEWLVKEIEKRRKVADAEAKLLLFGPALEAESRRTAYDEVLAIIKRGNSG